MEFQLVCKCKYLNHKSLLRKIYLLNLEIFSKSLIMIKLHHLH